MERDNQKLIIYTNSANVLTSPFDVVIELNVNLPHVDEKGSVMSVEQLNKAHIIMSPQHFKAFVSAMDQQLKKHEEKFGEIVLPKV